MLGYFTVRVGVSANFARMASMLTIAPSAVSGATATRGSTIVSLAGSPHAVQAVEGLDD
jgi:hypothetical protein